MKAISKIVSALALIVILMVCTIPATATTFNGSESDLYCYRQATNPTIDGNISVGEWTDSDYFYWYFTPISNHHNANIYVYAKHDTNYLYFMVDLCPDNTTENGDFCDIILDEDHDGTWGWGAAYEHEFIVYGNQTLEMTSINATQAHYFNYTFAAYFGYASSAHAAWDHRIIEFRVDLATLNVSDEMGLVVTGYGTLSPDYISVDGAFSPWSNSTMANATTLHMMDTEMTTGTFTDLTAMVVTLMGAVIAIVVVLGIVKMLGKSFKKIG